LFDIEKMAKKEKKKPKFTLKKTPLSKDLSIFLSKNDQMFLLTQ
jgi:hypothetical protein